MGVLPFGDEVDVHPVGSREGEECHQTFTVDAMATASDLDPAFEL